MNKIVVRRWILQENIRKKYWSERIFEKKCYKVRNHCHYRGKHQETAHSIDDLCYKANSFISVLADCAAYDNHSELTEISRKFKNRDFLLAA